MKPEAKAEDSQLCWLESITRRSSHRLSGTLGGLAEELGLFEPLCETQESGPFSDSENFTILMSVLRATPAARERDTARRQERDTVRRQHRRNRRRWSVRRACWRAQRTSEEDVFQAELPAAQLLEREHEALSCAVRAARRIQRGWNRFLKGVEGAQVVRMRPMSAQVVRLRWLARTIGRSVTTARRGDKEGRTHQINGILSTDAYQRGLYGSLTHPTFLWDLPPLLGSCVDKALAVRRGACLVRGRMKGRWGGGGEDPWWSDEEACW